MDIRLIAQVACSTILAVLATHGACQGADCWFRFHQQPGPELTCNPHSGSTTLHATCFASGPLRSSLRVVWWYSKFSTETSSSTPHSVGGQSEYEVIETIANNSLNTLISSTLSLRVGEEVTSGARGGVCVWCELQAPGITLVDPASNRLCVREAEAYGGLQGCESHEVVPHIFNRVCVRELGAEGTKPITSATAISSKESLLQTQVLLVSLAVGHREVLASTSMLQTGTTLVATHPHNIVGPESDIVAGLPSKTIGALYTSPDTPSAYIEPFRSNSVATSTLTIQQLPITPALLPLPTPAEEGRSPPGSALGGEGLTALYAAVAVCLLLAAVVLVLTIIVLLLCRRHTQLRRRRRAAEEAAAAAKSPKFVVSRTGQYRSQLSFSGSETVMGGEIKRDHLARGGGGELLTGAQEIRRGSEPEALKGSLDTRSSVGSRSISTEKSNSLPRKNSLQHKYAEIDTISHSESHHSKMSLPAPHTSDTINYHHHTQQLTQQGRNGCVRSKVVPPPPNMRTRSSSTPHFYYILERIEGDEGGGEGNEAAGRLKRPWEVGAPRPEKSRSREGSAKKNRSSSLKREVGREAVEPGVKTELCWGDGTMRSRSGSCPGKGGGSGKRIVISREGSGKTKSRSGSGKKREETSGRGGNVAESREGSIKSRSSRDGSCKKEVWVPPAPDLQQNNSSNKCVPPPYDALEPRFASYPTSFSIINESYLGDRAELFDDPKYAAVSVGDLPQLVNQQQQHHQSLDHIIPHHPSQPRSNSSWLQGHCGGVRAASSKSLQDSGGALGGGEGGRGEGERGSIYRTRDSTPVRGTGRSSDGNTPSRLSMPFDSYHS